MTAETNAAALAEKLDAHAELLPRSIAQRQIRSDLRSAAALLRNAESSVPEGCTPADARILREGNHALAMESHELQEALADLCAQVKLFCETHGEADFETGRAATLLHRLRPDEAPLPPAALLRAGAAKVPEDFEWPEPHSSELGRPVGLMLVGFYIDGPRGYTFCRERERIEINVNGIAASTGDDPDDYTATEVYAVTYSATPPAPDAGVVEPAK